jgi:branched-chain amino acid transport system substrate-binding protein
VSIVCVLVLVLLTLANASCKSSPKTPEIPTVAVGALYAKTGSFYGGAIQEETLQLAAKYVNDYLRKENAGFEIKVVGLDTKSDPDFGLSQAKVLAAQGIRIIIGPQTSSECAKILPWANENGIIVLGTGITTSLTVEGDNLFRLDSDLSQQANAISMVFALKVPAVISVWRDDVWGRDLVVKVLDGLKMMSGSGSGVAVLDSISYLPNQMDADKILAELEEKIPAAIDKYGSVVVFLAGFDEAIDFLARAGNSEILHMPLWLAADGFSIQNLTKNPAAATFAADVGLQYIAYEAYGMDTENITAQLKTLTGQAPNDYNLVAYDCLWVVAKTLHAAGISPTLEAFKAEFPNQAYHYFGVSGWTRLNKAGDRLYGRYNFKSIVKNGDKFEVIKGPSIVTQYPEE